MATPLNKQKETAALVKTLRTINNLCNQRGLPNNIAKKIKSKYMKELKSNVMKQIRNHKKPAKPPSLTRIRGFGRRDQAHANIRGVTPFL